MISRKLPNQVNLIVHTEQDGGFWVEFPDLPGCFTQGDDLSQLPAQVEDALLTYFDVPREQARKITGLLTFEGKGKLELQHA